jgi:hypothetical protein
VAAALTAACPATLQSADWGFLGFHPQNPRSQNKRRTFPAAAKWPGKVAISQ